MLPSIIVFGIQIGVSLALGSHFRSKGRSHRNDTSINLNVSAALVDNATQFHVAQSASAKTTSAAMKMQMGMRDAKQQCNIINEYAPNASLCMKGHDKWSRAQLSAHIPKFRAFLDKQKAILPMHCCMGVNHMFALHYLVDTLKPSAIIESGVAAGHQTFMLRETAPPGTKIFSLDPGDPLFSYGKGSYGSWKDLSGLTTYFTGPLFKDFAQIEWDVVIPDREVR